MSICKVSIYGLQNGKFQVSYMKFGKRVRKKFNSFHEAKEFEFQIISEKIVSTERSTKIQSLISWHLEVCPNSKFKSRFNTFSSFISTFGQLEIVSVTSRDLARWFDLLRRSNNYTEKTLSHIKSQVNHFYKFLIEFKILNYNPLDIIKFKQNLPPRRSKILLSPLEIKLFLETIKKLSPTIFYPFFYTLIHTGARRSEVANLLWSEINLSMGILTFKDTKNGTDRTINLPTNLINYLESIKSERLYVFKGKRSNKITNAQLYRFFQKLRKKFPNLQRVACHDLRHSFAYNFLKKGGNMYSLKAILGHKSIQMTIDLYGNFKSSDVVNPSPYDF